MTTLLLDRPTNTASASTPQLANSFGRAITYIRLSVTDRCNFRCVYCMAEKMTFLPHAEVLRLEELDRLCSIFVGLGVKKIRLTGGEPLVRRGVMTLFQSLSRRLRAHELDELTLTTNGSQLARLRGRARRLRRQAGERVSGHARRGDIRGDLAPRRARRRAGGRRSRRPRRAQGQDQRRGAEGNHRGLCGSIDPLGAWSRLRPHVHRGDAAGRRRRRMVAAVHAAGRAARELVQHLSLLPTPYRSGGPARYWQVEETGGRIGFITPMTHSFCDSCNRVRITCAGRMYLCLGHEAAVDLGKVLRASDDDAEVAEAIRAAVALKPKGHAFGAREAGAPRGAARSISVTGG